MSGPEIKKKTSLQTWPLRATIVHTCKIKCCTDLNTLAAPLQNTLQKMGGLGAYANSFRFRMRDLLCDTL